MSQLIANGVSKLLVVKKQTGVGVKAPAGAAGTSQYMRRVTSNLSLKKATYGSNEIRPSQQRADFRHGLRTVDGTINGEASVGTYQQFEESLLRGAAQAAVTSGAQTTIALAPTTGFNGTLTRTAGSFITDGFKVGMVVRTTGYTAPAAVLNGVNLFISALTATVMTFVRLDDQAVPTKVAGDSVTIAEAGKHIVIPQTGQTRDYYTIEHNFADVKQSEQFHDCVVTQMAVKLPGSGMVTNDFTLKGLDMDTTDYSVSGTSYFTSPAAASNGAVLSSSNGLLYVNGNPIALITSMDFTVNGNHTNVGGTVGNNTEPDLFPGTLTVDGSVTVLFQDATMRDYFVNETEVGIYAVFTTDNSGSAGFKAYSFPRCKMGGADKDDGNKSLVMTMPFTALENVNAPGTANHQSTIVIQDSAFV